MGQFEPGVDVRYSGGGWERMVSSIASLGVLVGGWVMLVLYPKFAGLTNMYYSSRTAEKLFCLW